MKIPVWLTVKVFRSIWATTGLPITAMPVLLCDKVLCFTQFAEFGSLLQPYLAAQLDRPVLWLHGGLSKARRAGLDDESIEALFMTTFRTGARADVA